MTTSTVNEAEAAAAAAKREVEQTEAGIVSGDRSVSAAVLHKLRDTWRHADLTAQRAREDAEKKHRQARMDGLAAVGAEVDKLAAGDGAPALADALRDVAAACDRARDLARAHDTAVADLVAAATDLRAEPQAPAGPRRTSAYVAVQGDGIVHRTTRVSPVGHRIGAAIQHALSGDTDRAVAEVATVMHSPQSKRPDRLLRNRDSGMLIAANGELNNGMQALLRNRTLVELSQHDIDLYMRGELG